MQQALDALNARADAAPQMTWISALGIPGYRLRAPLPVEVHAGPDGAAAASPDLDVYAEGEDATAAVEHLRAALAEEFAFLVEHEGELGPGLIRQLASFREVLAPA